MKDTVMKEFSRRGIDGRRPDVVQQPDQRRNIGSASIYIILDEMMEQGDQGQRHDAVHGPESGRSRSFMHLTAVRRIPDGDRRQKPPRRAAAPRAVVYLYTQTGQLREVAQALTAPLETHGWDIRRVDVRPRDAFPSPGRFDDSSECSRKRWIRRRS